MELDTLSRVLRRVSFVFRRARKVVAYTRRTLELLGLSDVMSAQCSTCFL
jgi:hypothetical protein